MSASQPSKPKPPKSIRVLDCRKAGVCLEMEENRVE